LISAGAARPSAAPWFLTGQVARFSRLEINEKVRRAPGLISALAGGVDSAPKSFEQTITLR